MNRSILALYAGCLALSLTTPSAWAGSIATIDQSGSYNYTVVRQNGDNSHVVSHQINEHRYERLDEKLTSQADRTSYRYSRTGKGFRSRFGGAALGARHDVGIDQNGGGNFAAATQVGTNDSVTLVQSGTSNIAYTIQTGNNLQAQVMQSGNHNIALIKQRGW